MQRTARFILGTAFILAAFAATTCAQGMYWESTVTGGPQGEQVHQMWAMPKMMKTITKDQPEQFIVRLDKQLFITIDTNEKTYSEITFDEMEAAMKKINAKMDSHMAELKKKLAAMPEEQRKMMEKMMGAKLGDADAKEEKVTVKSTGEKKTISGFACTKTVVSQGDNTMMTLWVTKGVSGFDAMRKDWEEFSKRMMALNPMGGKSLGEAFKQIDGFPIQTEMMKGIVNTVTKVEKKTTAAGEFEVPSGYKKVKSQMLEEKGGDE
jgi:hypothetical protein